MSNYKHEIRNIELLTPYANNSRTHSDEQINQIARSIEEFGFTNPVLIDEDGGLIAGHGRIEAAYKLNLTDIPCIILTGLSETQKRALVITDNQLALNADWDFELLEAEIEILKESDFDVSLLGFDDLLNEMDNNEIDHEEVMDEGEEYNIVITCSNETEQNNLYEELHNRGLNIRIVQ